MQQKERSRYIDFFRGIGITLMIMGHIGFGHFFDKWIHGFHMPMFFFVSGFFYNKTNSIVSNVKKNAKKMMIPYCVWGIIHYLIWLLVDCVKSADACLGPLKNLFWNNSEGIPIAGAIWFLTAFFWANSIYSILDVFFVKKRLLHLIIFVLAILGCVATSILPFRMPWSMEAAFVGMGFFHVGRLLSGKMKNALETQLKISTIAMAMISFGVCSLLILVNGIVNMRVGNYAVVPMFWGSAVGIIISSIIICRKCEMSLGETLLFKIVSTIGKYSMAYLCLNQLFIKIFMAMVKGMPLPHIVTSFLVLLLTVSAIYFVDYIIGKTPLKIVFGR